MEKIKNIEFLRIIGCIAIIFLHLFNNNHLHFLFPDIELYDKMFYMTKNGQKAVDLFFILSGFFFAFKLDLTKSIVQFIKSKIIRLYPTILFTLTITILISFTGSVNYNLYDLPFDLLLLTGTPLVLKVGYIGVFWYVSSLLWALLFFFYLLKNYEKKNINLILAFIVIFSYGLMIHANGGKINNPEKTLFYIINFGMLRALGGIGLGYFIADWYINFQEKIKMLALSVQHELIITFLEFMCLYFIINNLMFHKLNYQNQVLFIINFVVIIVLFLLKQGFISRFLNILSWHDVAKYTYSFYLTHIVVLNTLRGSFWKIQSGWIHSHPVINLFITFLIVFIVGIFTYHFIEKPCVDYFKKAETRVPVERERERE